MSVPQVDYITRPFVNSIASGKGTMEIDGIAAALCGWKFLSASEAPLQVRGEAALLVLAPPLDERFRLKQRIGQPPPAAALIWNSPVEDNLPLQRARGDHIVQGARLPDILKAPARSALRLEPMRLRGEYAHGTMGICRLLFSDRLTFGFVLAAALHLADACCVQADGGPRNELPPTTEPTHDSALERSPPLDFTAARAALMQSCGDCHGESEGEGSFSLRPLAEENSLVDASDQWMRLRNRLADGSMPPLEAEPLPLDQRTKLWHWVDDASRHAFCKLGETAGPSMFRRLTAHEYSNSIRDLLAVNFDAGHALPQDVAGGEGFDNAAETLTISPIHAEIFLDAATDALNYAASDSESRALLLPTRPSEKVSESDAARANLSALASRAFRRPVDADELKPYVKLYDDARADGLDFDSASYYAMRGILTSPHFLFLSEAAPKSAAAEPLSQWELASRLSYFLWASMPDQSLRAVADAGRLSDPEELRKQTLRMLGEGTHLNDSLVEFVGQWLGTADLGLAKQIDRGRFPWIKDEHVSAMRNQPVYIFESILRENGSLLELIDSDWTFLNEELIGVYKLERSKIDKKEISQHLVRVPLPEEYRYRAGLLGAGGVMTLAAYPQRTSAVLRGVWVLDKMLGVKLPPPPPNVPKLDETAEAAKAETQRQRLVRHRADPACAVCHNRIDPIGFSLENFDELGRWRDRDEGGDINAVAELSGGIKIDGVLGLKQYLLENKDQFVRHLTEKMLGYALARGLRPSDQATVETIVARLKANDYRAQELLLGIVESKPFRFKGEQP